MRILYYVELWFVKITHFYKQSIIMKWLRRLALLSVVFFAVYLNHLNNLVKDEFLGPLDATYSDLPLSEHPKMLVNMLLLTEDQSFFKHRGVDFKEIIFVLRDTIWFDKPLRGASTITQQLIKNSLLNREQTLKRKLNEVLMALLLEYSSDKEFILRRYMNSVYLGQQGGAAVYGFAQAAQFYFQKPLKLLSTDEMATLVALVKGPSFYHPIKHPRRLAKRRQLVLSLFNKYRKIVE